MIIPEYVREQARYELARRSFWEYCKLKAPDFYTENKKYLKEFCNELQAFLDSPKKVLVINVNNKLHIYFCIHIICSMVLR